MATASKLLLVLVLLAVPGLAPAAACEGGRYIIEEDLPFSLTDGGRTVVVIADDSISMEPCGLAPRSKIRNTRRGMAARAVWKDCGGVAGRVKLSLRTSSDCETAKGTVRSKRPRSRMRFIAERGCEFAILCTPGTLPEDANGDGCDDICQPCPQILCIPESVPVDSDGDGCDDTCVPLCGGFAGLPCEAGEFCDLPAGQCNTADQFGTCTEQAAICTQEYNPVCACNGNTYGNDCERRAAAVQLDHGGECHSARR